MSILSTEVSNKLVGFKKGTHERSSNDCEADIVAHAVDRFGLKTNRRGSGLDFKNNMSTMVAKSTAKDVILKARENGIIPQTKAYVKLIKEMGCLDFPEESLIKWSKKI